MNTFLCRRGPVAEPDGGGGDLVVSSEGDAGADRGGDPGVGDWMSGKGTPIGGERD
jgi:hypothetical protein